MKGVEDIHGCIYDPRLGCFLSPDPYVQDPTYSQSLNRYSYVWNNPLRYIDPTGYQTDPTDFEYYYHYDIAGVGTGTITANDYETFMRQLDALYRVYIYYSESISGVIDIEKDKEATKLEYCNKYGVELGEQLYKWELEHGESAFKVRYHYERITLPMGSQNSYEIINGVRYFNEVPVGLKKVYDNASLFDFNGGWVSKFGGKRDWFGVTASGQGGDYGWAKKTQTGIDAFGVANGAKSELINYAAKADPAINSMKYVKAVRVVGGVAFGASTVISAGLATNYYMNGGTDYSVGIKSIIDITMGVVGFMGPIGFCISATYFLIDAASGGFGGYGDPLKINKQ